MPHNFIGLLEKTKSPTPGFNKMVLLLNEIFRECVISRNLWPPRLPDLTPPDFYLWGAAKSAVYRDCPHKLNELKTAITTYTRNITQEDLQKVFANKIKRVQACIDTHGHHFKHLSLSTQRYSVLALPCINVCHHISTRLYCSLHAQRLSEHTVYSVLMISSLFLEHKDCPQIVLDRTQPKQAHFTY